MLAPLLGTFGLVVLAELGDKTQLLVAWLATRHRPWQVMLGVFIGSAAIHLVSAGVGGAIASVAPQRSLDVAAGILFLGFGAWAVWKGRDEPAEQPRTRAIRWPSLGIALAFFLAEVGDKTQLVAISRAAQYGSDPAITATEAFWGVWLGATLGMLVADGAAVIAGSLLAGRVAHRTLALVSGVLFLLFGAYTLIAAFL